MTESFPYAHHSGNAAQYELSHCVSAAEPQLLQGKTIFALGSSVTFGATSGEQALGEYLAYRHGAQLIKDAVSGTTLAGSGDDTYVARLKKHSHATDSPDIIFVQLSTNDAVQGLKLADIGTAIIEILDYIHSQWNAEVFFYTNARFDNDLYGQMVTLLYAFKDRRGDFSIIDLLNDKEFNSISDEKRTLYMVDSIHPTRAGYFLWWGPAVERQLLEQSASN